MAATSTVSVFKEGWWRYRWNQTSRTWTWETSHVGVQRSSTRVLVTFYFQLEISISVCRFLQYVDELLELECRYSL